MRTPFVVVSMLVATLAAAQQPKPKVYISVDMEGISGIVHGDQVNSEKPEYAAARRWMAEDVNAVVAGLLAAGAGEIVVNDSHGGMRNISPADLRPEASLISGTPKPLAMMAGIDSSFAACVFIGYHAEAGSSNAILDHTISGAAVHAITVNGVEMPELGLNALIAGVYDVPVIMLSGDAAACAQAKSVLGSDLVTVPVKEALSRTAARLVPFAEARRQLEAAAREAFAKRATRKPFRLEAPLRVAVSFQNSGLAEMGESVPGVTRTDPRTLSFVAQDPLEGFKLLRVLITLASAR